MTASYTCVTCVVVKYHRDEIRRHYHKVHGVIIPQGTKLPAEESDLQDYDRDETAAPIEAPRVVKLAGPIPARKRYSCQPIPCHGGGWRLSS